MEDICNLSDLLSRNFISTFNVVFYDFMGKQTLNSKQFYFQVDTVVQALESISADQTVIGCILSPCLAIPATILGILKVSSSFVFLDVHKPLASLRNIQKYAPVTILLVEELLLKSFREVLCCCWVPKKEIVFNQSVIILLQSLNCSSETCPNSKVSGGTLQPCNSQLAYIIQTSGTTGNPKVVQVPHQCILPNIIDLRSRFDVTCRDVVLLCSPLTFDPSIIDIFLAISTGCTLVIVPDKMKSVPKMLRDVIIDSKVTIFQCTPSLFQSLGEQFIKHHLLSMNSCLKTLAFGGESCPSLSKLHRWKSERSKTRIFNLYGLTEVSCWASCFQIDFDKCALSSSVPLGEPLLDTIIEVRNQEVYIGSKKRWCVINDEVWPDCNVLIMRPTGDIVCKTSDGQLYFEGRKDNVIKYKGQKLSLQGIHNFLEDVSEISNHFVHFDTELSKLLLFVVQNKEVYSGTDIRQKIITKLRTHTSHLPVTEVISVTHIPLTAHGKSGHRKLLEFAKEQSQLQETSNLPSSSSWEEIVSNFWKDYTNQSTIFANDNFILKGGDSILALQLASDIEWKLQIHIPELVEKLLNDSYKEVMELVRSHVKGASKMNQDPKLHFKLSNENTPEESPPKRICVGYFKCHEMSSRKGYSFSCNHTSGYTCHAKENYLPRNQRPSLAMICKFDLKKCIDASPTISHFFQSDQLFVFVGSHSGLFGCINVMKQNFHWITSLPDRIESSSCLSPCGNYVFVGCYDHHVYNLDANDGTILWKFKTGAEVKSSPVVSFQNNVYVGSHDKHLYAIKAQTGELLWKKLIGRGSIFSSPALSGHLSAVAAATLDGILSVLKMDSGATLWAYNHGRPLFSSPLFTSAAIFIGSTNNCLLQLDLSGSMVLEYETSGSVFSSACLSSSPKSEHIIFGCHDSHVYCINFGGECIWKCRCDSPVYATPFAFKWGEDNYVAVGSTSGTLYILAENSGEIIHFFKCPGEIFSSAVFLNDFLVVGCRDNYVYCFKLCDVL